MSRAEEGGTTARSVPEVTWHVHPPFRDCEHCHGRQRRRSIPQEVALTAPVPELCYGCHENKVNGRRWGHAPVIGGDCLWCHEHHRSTNEHLLLEPPPDLCYQCHDTRAIEEIEYHDLPTYRRCTDCHAGHSSDLKYLLIAVAGPGQAPFSHEDYKAVLDSAHEDAGRGMDLTTMLQTVAAHIEQGELGRARAYLMGIRGSGSVSDAQEGQWRAMVDRLQGAEDVAAEQRARSDQEDQQRIAQRYYESVDLYHRGDLEEARRGFVEVLESGLIPPPMRKTVDATLRRIDATLDRTPAQEVEREP